MHGFAGASPGNPVKADTVRPETGYGPEAPLVENGQISPTRRMASAPAHRNNTQDKGGDIMAQESCRETPGLYHSHDIASAFSVSGHRVDAARQNSPGECVITNGTSDCTRCKKIARAGFLPPCCVLLAEARFAECRFEGGQSFILRLGTGAFPLGQAGHAGRQQMYSHRCQFSPPQLRSRLSG